MAMIGFSKDDLRQAMRDPRGWDSWHPEREAYGAWVLEAWKTLDEAGALDGDGTTVVQVKGYHRTRNGKREWVGPYEQTRKAAEAENDNAALVPVRDDAPARPPMPPEAGDPTPPRVATLFIGGGGDGKSEIVSSFVENGSGTGFRQRFSGVSAEYFSWTQQEDVERRIRVLRAEHPGIRIHLVGHSYGGDTAAQISAGMARRGQPLDLLVTIDPVGRGTSRDFFWRVRDGSSRWINVNATGGGRLNWSNIVAGMGSPYDYGPMGQADAFLNAPVPHGNFRSMMRVGLADGRTVEDVVARR